MSEQQRTATVHWCLYHEREVNNRFVAAICPNEPQCEVVIRVVDSGSEARMALRYEVPPATPELRAAIDRLSDPRENGRSTDV